MFFSAIQFCVTSAALAQEKIVFPSNDADLEGGAATVLDGYLYRPEGGGPFPAIVGLHGCSGMLRDDESTIPLYSAWARHLRDNGYLVLLVDGFTPRGVRNVCGRGSGKVAPADVRPRDAYGALLHLRTRPDVRADRIALMGWSHGGGAVLYALAPASKARPAGLDRDFGAAIALYPGWCYEAFHGRDWKPAIPILVLLGEKDDWTPVSPCIEMMTRARARGAPVELVLYPDAHHGFDSQSPPRPRTDVRLPVTGLSPTVGGNLAARAAAFAHVLAFIGRTLGD